MTSFKVVSANKEVSRQCQSVHVRYMDLPNVVDFNRIKEFLILLVHSLDEFETIITIYC